MRSLVLAASLSIAVATTASAAEPFSTSASNITSQDQRSTIAPELPSPDLGDDARPSEYLRAAQGALATGKTGVVQQSLEMAQSRMLDRSVPLGRTDNPSDNPTIGQISQALQALAAGDRAGCMQSIQTAMASATAQGL